MTMEPTVAGHRIVIAACPLCGATAATRYAIFPELLWVKCECGLVYMRSALDTGNSPPLGESAVNQRYRQRLRRRISKSRHQILDVLNFVAPGPFLDIGCSLGYTLRAAVDLGLTASGLEISEAAARVCREQGYDVRVGTMTSLPFESGQFQIVSMKHVLEHTPVPRAALREVRRVLKDGGGLFIAVPHGHYRKAVRHPQTCRFFLPSGHGPESGHFIYYTPATLSRLLQEEGFTVVSVHPQRVHRHARPPLRLLQTLSAPLRWAGQRLMYGLGLKKEFWLVAVKR
jgi:SAM-dependent methyltransferase